MKICRCCDITKLEIDFYNDCSTCDGKSRLCKICMDNKNKRYKVAHVDEITVYQKLYRQQHSVENAKYQKQYRQEHENALAQQKQDYYKTHKEKWQIRAQKPEIKLKNNEQNKKAYCKDKEKFLERNRRWRQTDAGLASSANTHARRRAGIGESVISAIEWQQIMNNTDWKCVYCQISLTPKNRSLDHIIPLSKGGQHHIDNLVACCRTCNSKKGNKKVSDFSVGG